MIINKCPRLVRGLSMRLPVPSVATLATVALIIFINAMTQFNCQVSHAIRLHPYACFLIAPTSPLPPEDFRYYRETTVCIQHG
jgi:hypothetical protein